MAPIKQTRNVTKQSTTLLPLARKGITKRAQNIQDQNAEPIVTRGKRKAENSPLKNDKIKRSALGNLTNNVNTLHLDDDVKIGSKVLNEAHKKVAALKKENVTAAITSRPTKISTRANTRNAIANVFEEQKLLVQKKQTVVAATIVKKKDDLEVIKPPTRRISNEFNKTEESLYMSALEDISGSDSARYSGNFDSKRQSLTQNEKAKDIPEQIAVDVLDEDDKKRISTPSPLKYPPMSIPDGVVDFDKANWNDPFQVSHYAMDIFNYLKSREIEFPIEDYMPRQTYLSKWMRSLLVDWMVEVQETFELNHETLYLAVKLVDIFLGKVIIHKDKLQLLGAAALFIASKFDERTPPLIEDFLYICDGAYNHDELIRMEMSTLKTINFDLGIPLSYRFLRRYARCAKVPMPTLTLARYILEFSLMDYATISFSDSKMASAALMIALRMHGEVNAWTKTLEYYTVAQKTMKSKVTAAVGARAKSVSTPIYRGKATQQKPPSFSHHANTILKTVSILLAYGKRNSRQLRSTQESTKKRTRKMDEGSSKANPKLLESLRRKTRFTKGEIAALYRIYRKLVSNCQYAAKALAANTSSSVIAKPHAAVEGIDRIIFRELLHSTFDIVTEEILMERIFCSWDKTHEGLPLRLEGWLMGLSVFLRGTKAEKAAFCFRVYDLNADGFITKDEMFTLLRNCLIKQPQDEDPDEGVKDLVEIVLKKFDLDRDGKVSFEDFFNTVNAQPLLIEAFGQCLPTDSAIVSFFSTLQI